MLIHFRGAFGTQLNIHDGAILRKQLMAFGHYFRESAPSQMFDRVLNRPMVLSDNNSISLILKQKKSSTRELDMNWLTNK